MAQLKPGIYEQLLTPDLVKEVIDLKKDGWNIEYETDDSIHAELLSRHIYELVLTKLSDVTANNQIEIANKLIKSIYPNAEPLGNDERLLWQINKLRGLVSEHNTSISRPTLSLRQSGLLVNAQGDVKIDYELNKEIPSADRIDLLCAFVRYSGLRLFRDALKSRIDDGATVRVIASVYTGTTERRALDELVQIGAKVKISYETGRTRLHAKAWLFYRNSGYHTAYIGSSNLTSSAQVDGLEWNVRLSSIENTDVINRFEGAFEQYWHEPEFEDYIPERDSEKLDKALNQQYSTNGIGPLIYVDVAPKPFQVQALDSLEKERFSGHNRNLVVAATGTGKTWISAFDFKRLQEHQAIKSLLFIAHREEILRQSLSVFRLVLRDYDFGELLVGGTKPKEGHHIFASIQSLNNRIDSIDPNEYDMIIVDEFHHAAAPTYARVLNRMKPKILLGLTATPDRADGQSVMGWFDNRIASELRLWDAMEMGLLCPFHYFGINDETDLSGVKFKRGQYDQHSLENVFTGNDARALIIHNSINHLLANPMKMKALGFCVGVKHARFMAKKFNDFGYKAIALDSSSDWDLRKEALQELRKGELNVIFSVDLFNEGVDLPEVDTILLLRPTESATIFLQQLGRGLRICEEKHVVTVLDFVGLAHKKYRFDIRYRALIGGTRHQIQAAIENDFPRFPTGCAIRLDRIAKQTILNNLRQVHHRIRSRMVDDLRSMGPNTRLAEFIRESDYDLNEIYTSTNAGNCFTSLRRTAGFNVDPATDFEKRIGRMLHVDDAERINLCKSLIENNTRTPIEGLSQRKKRLALMLFSILDNNKLKLAKANELYERIRQCGEIRQEILDLLDLLLDRSRTLTRPIDTVPDLPFLSHASYSTREIAIAYDKKTKKGALLVPREGVIRNRAIKSEALLVTLEKSEKDFSPTTRYEDYPVSSTLFHWMSQNSTTPNTPVGRNYINRDTETKFLLFVRVSKNDKRGLSAPYICAGSVQYVRHESERPMKIIWKLDRELPGLLYQAGKVMAA